MSHSAELCLLKMFLPYAIKKWNKLDPEIRNAETYVFHFGLILAISRNTNLDITLLTH